MLKGGVPVKISVSNGWRPGPDMNPKLRQIDNQFIQLNFNIMKKLSKLVLHTEKLLTADELINIKGGYDYYCYWFDGFCYYPIGVVSGSTCASVIQEQQAYWGAPVSCSGGDCTISTSLPND